MGELSIFDDRKRRHFLCTARSFPAGGGDFEAVGIFSRAEGLV